MHFFKFGAFRRQKMLRGQRGLSHSSVVFCNTTERCPRRRNHVLLIPVPANWRLGIDVSKYRQNGLALTAQSHKCQFSIQQCPPNTHTFHQRSVEVGWVRTHVFICGKRNCLAGKLAHKEHHFKSKDFSLIWQLEFILPHPLLSHPCLPLALSLPDLLIADRGRRGRGQYKNPSIWLSTE